MTSVEVRGFECTPIDTGWKCTLFEKDVASKPVTTKQRGEMYTKVDVGNLNFENIEIRTGPAHVITSDEDSTCEITGDTLTCETEKEIPWPAQDDEEDDEDV